MNLNTSDQNGKPSINLSVEDHKEPKGDKSKIELPGILRPKFSRRRRRRRRKLSKESVSRDEDAPTQEKQEVLEKGSEDKDEEKPSLDRLSIDKPSVEKVETIEEGGHRDTREPTKEREPEEPECRDSEIRIVSVEPQNSDIDLARKFPIIEDKSDEKRKKEKKGGDSLDEIEKKVMKKDDKSKRRRRGQKKKHSGRNSGRKHQLQLSDDRKKRKKSKDNQTKEIASPKIASDVVVKLEKSLENLANKKGNKNKISDSVMKSPEGTKKQPPPKNKFNTFFKNIFDKTKLWMRKSDDVAQPTKEMLFKSYVLPEYDSNNPSDFSPDPSSMLCEKDLKLRLRNPKCERDDVFINNRPFWIHRTNEDVIPKCRLLAHTGLVAQYAQNKLCFEEKLPKRTFYDPKKESLEKLKEIDKMIGVIPGDTVKEKELLRVTSNTFYGTCMMQAFKKTDEGKKKLEEAEIIKFPTTKESVADDKKSGYVGLKVSFPHHEKLPQVNLYNRKERPIPGESRKFNKVDYIHEPTKKPSRHRQSNACPPPQQSHTLDQQVSKNKA